MDWVNPLIKINNKFKFQLFGRTYDNLLSLYAQYRKFDPNSQGGVSEHAFNLLLNAGGIFLTTQQIRTIKDTFPHKNGVNYVDFVQNVRNDITLKRQAVIDHVFNLLNENGLISLVSFVNNFNVLEHPHVRSLMKPAEKAKKDIEAGVYYFSQDKQHLTYEQFKQYCKDVNAVIPLEREEFFVDLLIHPLNLQNKGVTLDRILQLEVDIYERVRQRTYVKKDQGLKSTNSFRFIDIEEKNIVDFKLFVEVLDRLGCKYTEKQNKALFYKHSHGQDILDYENLCGLLFHMGSGNKDNVNPIFQMAKSGQGAITTHGMTLRLS